MSSPSSFSSPTLVNNPVASGASDELLASDGASSLLKDAGGVNGPSDDKRSQVTIDAAGVIPFGGEMHTGMSSLYDQLREYAKEIDGANATIAAQNVTIDQLKEKFEIAVGEVQVLQEENTPLRECGEQIAVLKACPSIKFDAMMKRAFSAKATKQKLADKKIADHEAEVHAAQLKIDNAAEAAYFDLHQKSLPKTAAQQKQIDNEVANKLKRSLAKKASTAARTANTKAAIAVAAAEMAAKLAAELAAGLEEVASRKASEKFDYLLGVWEEKYAGFVLGQPGYVSRSDYTKSEEATELWCALEAKNKADEDATKVAAEAAKEAADAVLVAEIVSAAQSEEPDAPQSEEPDAPQPEESKAAQPDAAQPDAAQPEVTQPDAAQPDAAQPDAAQPDAAQPDAAQPEVTQPEVTQPEAAQPEEPEVRIATPLEFPPMDPDWLMIDALGESEAPAEPAAQVEPLRVPASYNRRKRSVTTGTTGTAGSSFKRGRR